MRNKYQLPISAVFIRHLSGDSVGVENENALSGAQITPK
jgi:hypothetical protein